MKWSNSAFLGLICVFLILLNIYSVYQKKSIVQDLKTAQITIKNNQEKIKTLVSNLMERERLQYESEELHINENIQLSSTNENSDKVILNSLLSNEWTFIFDLSSISCTQCTEKSIDEEIELVKKLANEIGQEKVVILAHYHRQEDLDLFKRLNDFHLKIYNKGDGKIGLPVEGSDLPYMFLVSPSLKSTHLFIPNEEMPSLSKEYFSMVEKKF